MHAEQMKEINEAGQKVVFALMTASPAFAEVIHTLGETEKVVLDLSPETMAGIADGTLRFMGGSKAAIVNAATGKVAELPYIAIQSASAAACLPALLQAVQTAQLKKQLDDIQKGVQRIENGLFDIKQLLHCDRTAKFFEGEAEYARAQKLNNEVQRRGALQYACNCYSEATFKLRGAALTEIERLSKQLNKEKEKYSITDIGVSQVDSTMQELHEGFCLIHRAVCRMAEIDLDEGEQEAAKATFATYSAFIEEALGDNTTLEMLYQLDKCPLYKESPWLIRRTIPTLLNEYVTASDEQGARLVVNSKGEICSEEM